MTGEERVGEGGPILKFRSIGVGAANRRLGLCVGLFALRKDGVENHHHVGGRAR